MKFGDALEWFQELEASGKEVKALEDRPEIFPDLAVIDGFIGIEGNGPAWGSPIGSKVPLASLDAVAADVTGTRVMGFDPKMINYLRAMAEAGMGQGDDGQIQLLGTPLDQCVTKYKPKERMAEFYKL